MHAFPIFLNGQSPCPISLPTGARIIGVYGPEHGAGHATAQLVVLSDLECQDERMCARWFIAAKLGSTIETKARPEQFQLIGLVHASRPGGTSLPWAIMEVNEWAMR